MTNYLESVRKQFTYYKMLGEKTFDQLEEPQLFQSPAPESNSIAIIVNHLSGNMLSRWTNFLSEDGEKSWRDRDREFEDVLRNTDDLHAKWEEGWRCLFHALDTITPENFDQLVYIRNQGHTIVEAINRQLAHYAYHVGQIVYIGKLFRDKQWRSLSIARGASRRFNEEKFSGEKQRGHFTDGLIDGES